MLREGKNAVIYLRVSTEMQADGFSLDGQRSTIKRYAEREGIIVKEIYEDAGKSGKSIDGRPAFKQMLEDIKGGLDIDYILVYKLSRFGRNAADILTSIEYIQSYDINLIATEEGIDSSQTSGKLLISVLSAVAEIERENILEQTMNGRKEKARQGGWNGGFAPYGYKLENGKLIINEEEAKTVRKIFDLYANTKHGIGGVCTQINLTETKLRRDNVNTDFFSNGIIRNILDNPIYIGKIAFGRRKREKVKGTRNENKRVHADDYILVDGQQEAIIDNDLWEKAQDKRKKTGVLCSPSSGNPRAHLLSGILRCPCCGGKMNMTKSNFKRDPSNRQGSYYYVCYNYKRYKGFKCNYNKTIREDIIDSYIKVLVNELVKTPAFIQLVADSFKVKVDSNTIDEELNKLEAEYNLVNQNKKELEEDIDNLPLNLPNRNKRRAEMNERLYDMYDKLDLIINKIEECKSKKISLSNEQMTIENIKLFMYNFNEIYDECTEQERQQLIRYFFKRIDIYEDWTLEKLIKSIELNLRIHNDQKEITDILSDVPKNEVFDKLNNAKYNSNVGLEFNLEENGLLAPIYERVSLIFAEREKIKKQNKVRGPYKKKGKFSDIKEWVKENYNITIHNPQISCIKKQYGVAENGANYFQFKRGPRKDTAEIIRKALIHFGVITEDMKPISSEDVSIDSITKEVRIRASHYNRKQATYPEIMSYVKETYNLSVSTLQIAQVKREYGADMQSNRQKDDARHPNIPKEKRDALVEALYHFRIIEKV